MGYIVFHAYFSMHVNNSNGSVAYNKRNQYTILYLRSKFEIIVESVDLIGLLTRLAEIVDIR